MSEWVQAAARGPERGGGGEMAAPSRMLSPECKYA